MGIIGVMQSTRSHGSPLGSALVFYTSASHIIALQGTEAMRRHRFVAPPGNQIVGLQFDGFTLVGTFIERIDSDALGAVSRISGRAGSVVDQCRMELRDGSVSVYGDSGGSELGPWLLEPMELIVVVEQSVKEQCLGASLSFYTSLGHVYTLAGVTSARSKRFAAPPGRQVCNIAFERG